MSAPIAKAVNALLSLCKSFDENSKKQQATLKKSSAIAAQRKRDALKAAAEADPTAPRPHSVLRALTAALSACDFDLEEFFGLLVERFAFDENAELAQAIGFTALKEMNEFREKVGKVVDADNLFKSKKTKAGSSESPDGDVSLDDDDLSVANDFENDPESVVFVKVLLRQFYVSAEWEAAIRKVVRAFDENDEEVSGIDLGDENTEEEEDDDDDDGDADGDGDDQQEKKESNGHREVKAEDGDFEPAAESADNEELRQAALDALIGCLAREVFDDEQLEAVCAQREELREKREARVREVLALAEAARRDKEAESRRRREERKKHRHRKRSRDSDEDSARRRHKRKHKRRRHRTEDGSSPIAEQKPALLLAQ